MATPPKLRIQTHPLTPERWPDFEALMMSRFDTRHCWCMALRREPSYRAFSGESNRRAMKKVVELAAVPPGVLAYVDGVVAGWCAVAPREEYPQVRRVRGGAVDENVWSVTCFYVLRGMRNHGLSRSLLSAAVELAHSHGARAVEGYPVEAGRNQFRGVKAVFEDAGFVEVSRRLRNRPVMRLIVGRES